MNNFYNPYFYNSNSFVGYYVGDYNEVLSKPTPSNGEPIILVNLESGMLWSKKMIDNMPTIQPFKIVPIYSEVQKQPEPINNSTDILEELKALKVEIAKLKGGSNESE